MQKWLLPCIFAAFGGMLPTFSHLAATYTTQPDTPLPTLGVVFGLGLFSIISVVLCVAFNQTELRQALVMGIAAPGIITNILSGVNTANGIDPGGSTGITSISKEAERLGRAAGHEWLLHLAAYQSVLRPENATSPGQITVAENGKRISFTLNPENLSFFAGGETMAFMVLGKRRDAVSGEDITFQITTLTPANPTSSDIVPEDTFGLLIQTYGESDGAQLPPGNSAAAVEISVRIRPSILGDFRWSLGMRRTSADLQISTLVRPQSG